MSLDNLQHEYALLNLFQTLKYQKKLNILTIYRQQRSILNF